MSRSNSVTSLEAHTFSTDPSLAPWNQAAETCLRDHSQKTALDGVATACVVFNSDNKILVIQRASHDSLPNKWELPGGAVDEGDLTVLHGAARELREESGLTAKHFTHVVTQGQGREAAETFSNRHKTKTFVRFTFAVDVETCEHVQLDPNEHQAYVWVSEQNIREEKVDERELITTKPGVTAIILEAFRLKKKRPEAL